MSPLSNRRHCKRVRCQRENRPRVGTKSPKSRSTARELRKVEALHIPRQTKHRNLSRWVQQSVEKPFLGFVFATGHLLKKPPRKGRPTERENRPPCCLEVMRLIFSSTPSSFTRETETWDDDSFREMMNTQSYRPAPGEVRKYMPVII